MSVFNGVAGSAIPSGIKIKETGSVEVASVTLVCPVSFSKLSNSGWNEYSKDILVMWRDSTPTQAQCGGGSYQQKYCITFLVLFRSKNYANSNTNCVLYAYSHANYYNSTVRFDYGVDRVVYGSTAYNENKLSTDTSFVGPYFAAGTYYYTVMHIG